MRHLVTNGEGEPLGFEYEYEEDFHPSYEDYEAYEGEVSFPLDDRLYCAFSTGCDHLNLEFNGRSWSCSDCYAHPLAAPDGSDKGNILSNFREMYFTQAWTGR